MRPLLPLLIASLLGLGACSVRERANPFDPRNSSTAGRPSGFAALAGNHQVELRWQFVSGTGLIGYQLFRRVGAQTEFTALSGLLPSTTTRYVDYGLLNGSDHAYRLFYVFDRGLGGQPAEDTATPGAVVPWVVDPALGVLDRLSADGRHVAFEKRGLGAPTAVAVDSILGRVWVSDSGFGTVHVFDPVTGVSVVITGLGSPAAIAVDNADGTAWVCDEQQGRVYHFNPGGGLVGPAIEPLSTPIGVAVDPGDRTLWICERGASHVLKRNPDGTARWSLTVNRPSRVAVDAVTHEGWVSSHDGGAVVRISATGSVIQSSNFFSGPVGIAVDARRGRIWVADTEASRVLALRRDASVEFTIDGLPQARDIAVDIETGEAWAALPGSGEVARLSPTGTVVRRLRGFAGPYGIAVDPGVRR